MIEAFRGKHQNGVFSLAHTVLGSLCRTAFIDGLSSTVLSIARCFSTTLAQRLDDSWNFFGIWYERVKAVWIQTKLQRELDELRECNQVLIQRVKKLTDSLEIFQNSNQFLMEENELFQIERDDAIGERYQRLRKIKELTQENKELSDAFAQMRPGISIPVLRMIQLYQGDNTEAMTPVQQNFEPELMSHVDARFAQLDQTLNEDRRAMLLAWKHIMSRFDDQKSEMEELKEGNDNLRNELEMQNVNFRHYTTRLDYQLRSSRCQRLRDLVQQIEAVLSARQLRVQSATPYIYTALALGGLFAGGSVGMAFVHPIAVMGLQLLTGGVSVGGIAYYQKQYALEPQEQEKVTQIFKEFQKTLRDLGVVVENYSPEDLYVNWESLISSQPLINPP